MSDESRDQDEQGRGPSTAEKVLTAISIAFTVLVFAFVAWQAVQPPTSGAPRAKTVGVQTGPNGSTLVHVRITNPGNAGLLSATVEANCSQPPPEVAFENVPAGGQEEGVLVCPAGTTDLNVSVSSWIPV